MSVWKPLLKNESESVHGQTDAQLANDLRSSVSLSRSHSSASDESTVSPTPEHAFCCHKHAYACRNRREAKCFLLGLLLCALLAASGAVAYYFLSQSSSNISTTTNALKAPVFAPFNASDHRVVGSDFVVLKWSTANVSSANDLVVGSYNLQIRVRQSQPKHGNPGKFRRNHKTRESTSKSNEKKSLALSTAWKPWMNVTLADKGIYGVAAVYNLAAKSVLQFRVRSCNSDDANQCDEPQTGRTSNWSSLVIATTLKGTEPAKPCPVTGKDVSLLTISAWESEGVDLLTVAVLPLSTGGIPLTGFRVYFHVENSDEDNSTSEWQPFCDGMPKTNDNHIDDSGLFNAKEPLCVTAAANQWLNCSGPIEEGKLYQLAVSFENAVGHSPLSLATACIAPENAEEFWMCSVSTPPGPVQNVNFIAGTKAITVNWQPPSNTPVHSYQIQRDDWWNSTGLFNVSLPDSGLSLTASLGGLLPGISYHIRIRAVNCEGIGPWNDLQTVTTRTQPQCGNYNDLNIMKTNWDSFGHDITQVFVQCLTDSDRDKCAEDGIHNNVGLTSGCSRCWVQEGDCAQSNCFFQCMNMHSERCIECAKTKCFPATVECSGVPQYTFPPP